MTNLTKTIRVRFAPSPTGYLHIGGARTAMYNYLLAKAHGGSFILRVEDTDLERSEAQYEKLQIEDLNWLGIEFDESPAKPNAKYAPYRQSERLAIYQEYALKLVDMGLAFYDFCSEEELELMKQKSIEEGAPAYTGKWRDEAHYVEAKARVLAGEKTSIRFKVDANKSYHMQDLVRQDVHFPAGMVGDFVIMRSNGVPTFNFCNVIDDHLFEITHVLRGEEHLNNTVRQLMIYEAFNWQPPQFAHLSIMIGHDRQKLSKRHGATSVRLYQEEGYLPQALNNYLALLGWSHPEEKAIFNIQELVSVFDEKRFNASPAMYDIEKLKWTNAQHLRQMSEDELLNHAKAVIKADHFFQQQTRHWQLSCLNLYKEKISLIKELEEKIDQEIINVTFKLNESASEMLALDSTKAIINYLKNELTSLTEEIVSESQLNQWMDHCKNALNIKGKPLFMGFRVALTGVDHGPDLKQLVPLTSIKTLIKRLDQF
jgi:glutamyl-tRNA synthetase